MRAYTLFTKILHFFLFAFMIKTGQLDFMFLSKTSIYLLK